MKKLIELSKNPDKELFQESLFEYYKTENYGRKFLIELSAETNISFNLLMSYIYDYAEKKYGMNNNAFDKYRKQKREENKDYFIGEENFILKKYGIETKFLFRNDEEKGLFLKEIYEISLKDNFSLETTREMSKKLRISQSRYLLFLKEYMLDYLKFDPSNLPVIETANNIMGDRRREKNQKLRDLYSKIIEFDFNDDFRLLEELINQSGYNAASLSNNFYLYEKFYTEEESKKFFDNLSALKSYKNEQKGIRIKENNLKSEKEKLKQIQEEASNIIILYLKEKNISFMDFLIKYNITEEIFNDYLKSVMYNNEELYKKYLDVRDKKEQEYKNELDNIIKEIGNRLMNGYEENGIKREFDIIDYYLITKIPLPILYSLAEKKLPNKQSVKIKDMKNKYIDSEKYNSLDEKSILEEKRIVGIKRDSNGKMIEGSGREITSKEKERILNYLKKNEISINRMTYKAALNRYLNGFLTFDNKTLKLNS